MDPFFLTIRARRRKLLIAVEVDNLGPLPLSYVGFLFDSSTNIVTNQTWKCKMERPASKEWVRLNYDDTKWPNAVCYDKELIAAVFYQRFYKPSLSKSSCYISGSLLPSDKSARLFCRKYFRFIN